MLFDVVQSLQGTHRFCVCLVNVSFIYRVLICFRELRSSVFLQNFVSFYTVYGYTNSIHKIRSFGRGGSVRRRDAGLSFFVLRCLQIMGHLSHSWWGSLRLGVGEIAQTHVYSLFLKFNTVNGIIF